jgi:hypothetical protein
LPVWQLAAGLLAGTFVLIGAIALLRYPRPLMFVMLGLLLVIPTAGLAAYAVVPGPAPQPGLVLWLAFIPALAGIGTGVWMLAWVATRRSSLTIANLEVLSNGSLVAFGGLVLAISDVTALWQPWFGIADLVVNAAWVCAWIPARWRETRVESSVEIAARRPRVFSFMVEPSNWPRYQEDLESVTVRPAGRLAIGSRLTVRRRYESGVRGPRLLPNTIEADSVVTGLVPDISISMESADRPAGNSVVEFAGSADGTQLRMRAHTVVPFRLAVFGGVLQLRFQKSKRIAKAKRDLGRLKQLLEEPQASS